jgi:hypothetical protein
MGQKYAHVDADNFVIGFYDEHIHAESGYPDEAIAITDEDWTLLLDGQAEGKRMKVNDDGTPELIDPPPPTGAALAERIRARRNAALQATDWVVTRQQDQSLNSEAVTLAANQFETIASYRQALRDVPQQTGFPSKVTWPTPPAGLPAP